MSSLTIPTAQRSQLVRRAATNADSSAFSSATGELISKIGSHRSMTQQWLPKGGDTVVSSFGWVDAKGGYVGEARSTTSLAESLFDARAGAKVATSEVAMHLPETFRQWLFRQIDSLHDLEEWPEGEPPVHAGAVKTFLRFYLWVKPEILPSVGVTTRGSMIAVWGRPGDEVVIEFSDHDKVRWFIDHMIDGNRETASAETTLPRFKETILPYRDGPWFHAK